MRNLLTIEILSCDSRPLNYFAINKAHAQELSTQNLRAFLLKELHEVMKDIDVRPHNDIYRDVLGEAHDAEF